MDHMQYGLKPLDFNGSNADQQTASSGLTRRDFLLATLASGFALASQPILAQAIKTDSKGLTAGEVTIPAGAEKIPAYRAMPNGAGPFPTVLVIQEIFGVHEHIQDVCRRYAKLGYFAIAPELFVRQGDVSKMTDINEILTKVVSKVPDEQVFADLDAAVAYAKASKHANVKKLGIVGFCWGGRTVWLYAGHNPQVKAGVAYYGLLSGMKSAIKKQDPVDMGATLQVPVLGLYAGKDTFITMPVVEQMRTELRKGNSGSEIIVFPGVDHGFNADYRPTYDASAAHYAAELAHDWLHDHGV
ncbi:MAG: dienelactone hydrolase family protein [Gammaproteobacteria bacterium]